MNKPELLIEDYLHDSLDQGGWAELQQWIKADDAHMRRFVSVLMLEEEIRDAVHAKEGEDSTHRFNHVSNQSAILPTPPPSSSRPDITPTSRFARAAAWLGAFTWFSNKAQAAGTATSTILMTKSASTAITAALLVTGGGTLYLLHRQNQRSAARVEEMQAINRRSVDSSADHTASARQDATPGSRMDATALSPGQLLNQWRKLFEGDDLGSSEKVAKDSIDFYRKLETMNAEEFTAIAVEAEQMGDLPNMLVSLLVHSFARKSPEGATVHGTRLAVIAPEYDLMVVASAASAFETWLANDPTAAHAWYRDAWAAGMLVQKTIPPEGKEPFALHRNLSRVCFSALLESAPREAEAMIPAMLPDDVVIAIKTARELGRLDEGEAAGWIRRVHPDVSPDGP